MAFLLTIIVANSNVNIVSPLEDCLASFIGDQICDAKYNTEECTNDGGDCCNPESNFDSCHSLLDLSESNPCTCHLTGLGYYGTVSILISLANKMSKVILT